MARPLAGSRNVVVLTGAGVSASAGIPTFRGPGGRWNDPRAAELSHADALRERRDEVLAMFWGFWRSLDGVRPTAAHRALAAFEAARDPAAGFLLITQNVDGLHQAAGSRAICELHGSLATWRCEACGAALPAGGGDAPPAHCGAAARPGVVLFGEELPLDAERAAKRALRDCELFLAVGTSGTVTPAASFASWAALNGARRVLVNLEIDDRARATFDECHEGAADEVLPALLGVEGAAAG